MYPVMPKAAAPKIQIITPPAVGDSYEADLEVSVDLGSERLSYTGALLSWSCINPFGSAVMRVVADASQPLLNGQNDV